jgi:hypothetical protein
MTEGVLTCPECNGLEPAQVDTAEARQRNPNAEPDDFDDMHLPVPTEDMFERLNREVGLRPGGSFLKRMPDVTPEELEREAAILRGEDDS